MPRGKFTWQGMETFINVNMRTRNTGQDLKSDLEAELETVVKQF